MAWHSKGQDLRQWWRLLCSDAVMTVGELRTGRKSRPQKSGAGHETKGQHHRRSAVIVSGRSWYVYSCSTCRGVTASNLHDGQNACEQVCVPECVFATCVCATND